MGRDFAPTYIAAYSAIAAGNLGTGGGGGNAEGQSEDWAHFADGTTRPWGNAALCGHPGFRNAR
jgi:hypothetical protein